MLLGSIGPGAIRWCGGVSFTIFMDDEPATPHGPATLTVYDEGVRYARRSVAGRGSPASAGTCRSTPSDLILTRRAGGAEHVAGIVSADVTRASVELVGGRRMALDTHSYEGYNGRYASSLRFFTVRLEPGQSVVRVHLYDASGRRVHTEDSRGEVRAEGSPRLVVPGPPQDSGCARTGWGYPTRRTPRCACGSGGRTRPR